MNVQAFGIACVATLTLAISGANAQILYLYDDEANRSTELRLYDLETQKSEVIITGGLYQWNDLMGSPDGSAVLFQEFRGEFNDIGVVSASGGKVTHLTNRNGDNRDGAWSPDSDQIAFSSNRDDDYEIYAMDADGGNVHRLTNHQFAASWPSWSPDGREIAYVTSDDGQTDSLYVMKANGTQRRQLFRMEQGMYIAHPVWSPNGTTIAFTAGHRNAFVAHADIYTTFVDAPKPINRTNASGLRVYPSWSSDGRTLAYGIHPLQGGSQVATMPANGGEETMLFAGREPFWWTVGTLPVPDAGSRLSTWGALKRAETTPSEN